MKENGHNGGQHSSPEDASRACQNHYDQRTVSRNAKKKSSARTNDLRVYVSVRHDGKHSDRKDKRKSMSFDPEKTGLQALLRQIAAELGVVTPKTSHPILYLRTLLSGDFFLKDIVKLKMYLKSRTKIILYCTLGIQMALLKPVRTIIPTKITY